MILVDRLPDLPPRPSDGHKGTFGHALILAGSRGMSGAAVLAAKAALRGGTGLVTVAVPDVIAQTVAMSEPSYLTWELPSDGGGRLAPGVMDALKAKLPRFQSVAIGPGLGVSEGTTALVRELYEQITQPLVVDADGLNVLAGKINGLMAGGPRVLTPHPGEFARLLGCAASDITSNREELAVEFARKHKVVLVLKGCQSLITDGSRLAVNITGNSGMATGGSGDVLTGLIAALLAQGCAAFESAQLAAHLHGLAGDLAAEDMSEPGIIASDLPSYIAKAWKRLLR